MKVMILVTSVLAMTQVFAHPSGTYKINKNPEVKVTMEKIKKCENTKGAMKGNLKKFTFSPEAAQGPYKFVTGMYVEEHRIIEDKKVEIYVQTDKSCVPVPVRNEYKASRTTFNGFSIQKI